MLPEFYNQLVAMHGSVMVFLAIVPLAAGAFANYLVPDHIGAPEMAFPRLNALELLAVSARGPDHGRELLRRRRRREFGMDLVPAARGDRHHRAELLAGRHLPDRRVVGAERDQHDRYDRAMPRRGRDAGASAVLCVVAAGHRAAVAARLPRPASCGNLPTDGSHGGHQLLPAERVDGRRRAAARRGRRRQSAAVAAPVLVPRSSRGLRPDPPRDGHRRGGDHQQRAAAAVGTWTDGVGGAVHGRHVDGGVGAPHVPYRHGRQPSPRSSR